MSSIEDSSPKSLDISAHKAVSDFPFNEKSSTPELRKSLELLELEELSESKKSGSESVLGSLGLLAAGYLLVSSVIGTDSSRKTDGVIAGTIFSSAISAYYLHRKRLSSSIYKAKQTYKRAVENQIRARREDGFF